MAKDIPESAKLNADDFIDNSIISSWNNTTALSDQHYSQLEALRGSISCSAN